MPCPPDGSASRGDVRTPLAAAGLIALLILGIVVTIGRAYGREPGPAWVCDDTRYTQLVPRGRAVVGAPVSPPPGCVW